MEADLTLNDTQYSPLFGSTITCNISTEYGPTDKDLFVYYPDYSQIPWVRLIFLLLFITECVVGVIGNLLISVTVYRNTSMHSPVNYYIVNLAACDFLVGSFVLPMKLFELMASAESNMMTNVWCTTLRYSESVVVFASVFTLTALSVERYYAIVSPVHSRARLTDGHVHRVVFLVWLIPLVFASPSLYPAESQRHQLFSELGRFTRKICHDVFPTNFRRGYFLFLFIFVYIVPLCFITSSCVLITKTLLQKIPVGSDLQTRTMERSRRKAAKMILAVVLSFGICWSPYFVVTAITQVYNFFDKGQYIFTMLVINIMAFTHSCVNPIIYFSMSSRFRNGLMVIVEAIASFLAGIKISPKCASSSIQRVVHLRVPTHISNSDRFVSYNRTGGERQQRRSVCRINSDSGIRYYHLETIT